MLQVGSVLDNKYKILSEIGHGGMSVVYLAINERAGKTWAIKEIRKDGVMDYEQVKAGLVVETEMLKKLKHDHLASIIDVIDRDDSFIIVMDYIEGKSAKEILSETGAQSYDMVVDWGKQICEVLGYLHSRQPAIIYRDMKPSNLMIKPPTSDYPYGKVMLIDFGTAREFKDRAMVEDTTCLGTRGYAAPEQFGGQGQTDGRTDIYCLGATLYHLVTNHSPAEPPYEIKPLGYWYPQYAESGLEYIINKCCQQDPGSRYQSCNELLYDLENIDDVENRGGIKTRWKLFILSLVMILVGSIAMVTFTILGNSASTESYDYYVQEGNGESSVTTAATYYKKAMAIDPGRSEAYTALVDAINHDGKLESDEIQCINSTIKETEGSTRTYADYLKNSNPKEYDEVMYEIGLLYFFEHENSESDMQQAAKYFENVLESTNLTTAQVQLANSLYKIGNYYSSLLSGNLYTADVTFSDFWNDLKEMVSGNVSEKVGGAAFSIQLYNQVAWQITQHIEDFNNAGISQSEMTDELNIVKNGLDGINTNSNTLLEEVKNNALNTVTEAEKAIASYFDGNRSAER